MSDEVDRGVLRAGRKALEKSYVIRFGSLDGHCPGVQSLEKQKAMAIACERRNDLIPSWLCLYWHSIEIHFLEAGTWVVWDLNLVYRMGHLS